MVWELLVVEVVELFGVEFCELVVVGVIGVVE